MPIPLSRLTRVLDAAAASNRIIDTIIEVAYPAALGRGNPISALQNILALTRGRDDIHQVILEERARQNLTQHKNYTERERMRAKRAGIPFKDWLANPENIIQPGQPATPANTGTDARAIRTAAKYAASLIAIDAERDLTDRDLDLSLPTDSEPTIIIPTSADAAILAGLRTKYDSGTINSDERKLLFTLEAEAEANK